LQNKLFVKFYSIYYEVTQRRFIGEKIVLSAGQVKFRDVSDVILEKINVFCLTVILEGELCRP